MLACDGCYSPARPAKKNLYIAQMLQDIRVHRIRPVQRRSVQDSRSTQDLRQSCATPGFRCAVTHLLAQLAPTSPDHLEV